MARGISAFLVDGNLDGVKVGEPPRMLGNEGSHVCYVWFEDCRVAADALVGGQEGAGLRAAPRVRRRTAGEFRAVQCCLERFRTAEKPRSELL